MDGKSVAQLFQQSLVTHFFSCSSCAAFAHWDPNNIFCAFLREFKTLIQPKMTCYFKHFQHLLASAKLYLKPLQYVFTLCLYDLETIISHL